METETTRYNGWTNYETWAVKLWMDNDEGLYLHLRDMAQAYGKATAGFADSLKDLVEESAPELEASMYSDLLTHAIGRVDWFEIAENLLSELDDA